MMKLLLLCDLSKNKNKQALYINICASFGLIKALK